MFKSLLLVENAEATINKPFCKSKQKVVRLLVIAAYIFVFNSCTLYFMYILLIILYMIIHSSRYQYYPQTLKKVLSHDSVVWHDLEWRLSVEHLSF